MWGVTDNDHVRWTLARLAATPVGHFKEPVRRTNPRGEKLPRAYIRCRQFPNPRFDRHAEMAQGATRHGNTATAPQHAPITVPDKVTDILLELLPHPATS